MREPYTKQYYLKHKEAINRRNLAWYYKNPSYFLKSQLKTRYGITFEQYSNLVTTQENKCAICKQPEKMTLRGRVKKLSVDHNHITGKVRGLLCSRCNAALGHFSENIASLQTAISYLRG